MKTTWYFLRKELLDAWRNYHILIIMVVFVLFGIEGPLMAKLTPDILKMATNSSQVVIKLPNPTSIDAWQQYYKNITQVGIYLLAVIFSGTVSAELSKGTLVNLVTKGLPRYAIILSKYIMAMSQWTMAILVAFVINWAYTAYYFPDTKSPSIWLGMWPLLVFGLMFVAMVILGSTFGRNNYGGFLLAVTTVIALTLLNMVKSIQRWNPISLVSDNMALVQGTEKITHVLPAVGVTIGAAIISMSLAVTILKKKRL